MDVPATLLDMAGVSHPATWRGRAAEPMIGVSMADHLAGTDGAIHAAKTETGWELFGRRAIRRGNWKAVWLRELEGPGCWQLFDLAADPGEMHDRAGDDPACLASLISAWDRYAASCGVVEGPVSIFEMDHE